MNTSLLKAVSARTAIAATAALLAIAGTGAALLPKKAQALAPGATELRLSSAAPTTVEAGTGTTTFSVKEVRGLPFNGWTNVLTGVFTGATIQATVTTGQISTDCATWGTTATVSIGPGLKVVEGTFCYRSDVVGAHDVTVLANVVRPGADITDTLIVPISVQDTVAPGVPTVLSPANGAVLRTADLASIDWTDSTDVSNPVTYYYESATSNVLNPDGSFFAPVFTSGALTASQINTPGTPEGVYYYHVRAEDSVGNSSAWTAVRSVTVDNTAPVITHNLDTTPLRGTVTVTETVVDDNPLAYNIRILTPSGDPVEVSGVNLGAYANPVSGPTLDYVWDTTTVPDGLYKVQFSARDKANNATTIFYEVTVDNTAPIVTVNSLATISKQPTVSGTVDDPDAVVTVTIDGVVYAAAVSPVSNPSGTFNWYVEVATDLAYGTYEVVAEAVDVAGNTGTDTTSNELTINKPVVIPVTPVVAPTSVASLVNSSAASTANSQDTAAAQTGVVDTPDTDNNSSQEDAGVQAATTDNKTSDKDKKDANPFLGLGWWWLLILLIIALLTYYLARRKADEK